MGDRCARIRFPAMGSTVTVALDGPPALAVRARSRIEDLERKWSRFLDDSEVSRLNRSTAPERVSVDTRLLLRCAVVAWRSTGGGFDPSVHDALVRWGYDRDLPGARGPDRRPSPTPAPGLAGVGVDDSAGTATLGLVRFDPGGIGKGLAADLVATELIAAGATSALVSVGGDLRVASAADARADGWTVGIEDPGSPALDLGRLRMTGGGISTSSPRRRWPAAGNTAHHLFDPRTGAPSDTTLAGVTVLAGEAWWADALTKAVLVDTLDIADLPTLAASGIGRTHGGSVVGTEDLLSAVRVPA